MSWRERGAAASRLDGLARLESRHRFAAVRFLAEEVAHNAYLLAQIDRGAIGRDDVAGPILGHWSGGALDGICVFGSNLVFSRPSSDVAIAAYLLDRYGFAAGDVPLPDDRAALEGIGFWQ